MAQEHSRPLTEKEIALLVKNKPSEYFNKIKDQIQEFDRVIEGFHPDVFAFDEKLLVKIPKKYFIFVKDYDVAPELFAKFTKWLPLLTEAASLQDLAIYYQARGKLLKCLQEWEQLSKVVDEFETIKKAAASIEWDTIARLFVRITDKNRPDGSKINRDQIFKDLRGYSENVRKFFNKLLDCSEEQRFALYGLEDEKQALEVKKKLSLKTIKEILNNKEVETNIYSRSFHQKQNSSPSFSENNQNNNNQPAQSSVDIRFADIGSRQCTAQLFQKEMKETELNEEIAEKFIVYAATDGKHGLKPPEDKRFIVLLQQFMDMSNEFERLNDELQKANKELKQLENETREMISSFVELPGTSNKKNKNLKKSANMSFEDLLNWLNVNQKPQEREDLLQKQEPVSKNQAVLSEKKMKLLKARRDLNKFCSRLEVFEYYVQSYFVERIENSKDFLTRLSLLSDDQKLHVVKQIYKFFGLDENGAVSSESENDVINNSQFNKTIETLAEIGQLEKSQQDLLFQFKKLTRFQQETIIERHVFSRQKVKFIERINSLGVLKDVKQDIDVLGSQIQKMEESGIYHDADLIKESCDIEKKYKTISSWGGNQGFCLDLIQIKDRYTVKNSPTSSKKTGEATPLYLEVTKCISSHQNTHRKIEKNARKNNRLTEERKFLDIYQLYIEFLHDTVSNGFYDDNKLMSDIDFLIKQAAHIVYIGRTFTNAGSGTRLQNNLWNDEDVKILTKITTQKPPKELLTGSLRLQLETREALSRGNTVWFEIMLGLGYVYAQEKEKSDIGSDQLYIKKRRLLFSLKILNQQKSFLNEHKEVDLTDPVSLQAFENGLKQAMDEMEKNELSVLAEELQKEGHIVYMGQTRVSVDPSNIEQVLEYYKLQYVDSTVKELTRRFKPDSVVNNILQEVKAEYNETSFKFEAFQAEQTAIQMHIQTLATDYEALKNKLKRAGLQKKLPPDYARNIDNISSALLDHVIDINYKDDQGNTLLHVAFGARNARAVKLLLDRNANILEKNKKGISVFAMVIEEMALDDKQINPAVNEINKYLEGFIEEMIPDVYDAPYPAEVLKVYMPEETKVINDIWMHIIAYHHKELKENIRLPFAWKVLTGVYFYLEERKMQCEKYYQYLTRASTHKENSTLINYLRAVLHMAQNAGRGLLGGSRLNGEVQKLSEKYVDEWPKNKREYERRRNEMSRQIENSHTQDQIHAVNLRNQLLVQEMQEQKAESQKTKSEFETKLEEQKTEFRAKLEEQKTESQKTIAELQAKLEAMEKKAETEKHESNLLMKQMMGQMMEQMIEEAKQKEQRKKQQTENISTEEDVNARNNENNNSVEKNASKEISQSGGPGFFDRSLPKQRTILQIPGLAQQPLSGKDFGSLRAAVRVYLKESSNFIQRAVSEQKAKLEGLRELQSWPSSKTADDYLNDLEKGTEWPDKIELEILMRVLDRPILVVDAKDGVSNGEVLKRYSAAPILVYHTDQGHYDALVIEPGANSQSVVESLLAVTSVSNMDGGPSVGGKKDE